MKTITLITALLLTSTLSFGFWWGSIPDEAPVYTTQEIHQKQTAKGSKVLYNGTIADKRASGSFSIIQTQNGERYLILAENFKTKKAPDIKVLFSPHSAASRNGKNAYDQSLDLGLIQRYKGLQAYKLDPKMDLSDYNSLLIHCLKYDELFGGAELSSSK